MMTTTTAPLHNVMKQATKLANGLAEAAEDQGLEPSSNATTAEAPKAEAPTQAKRSLTRNRNLPVHEGSLQLFVHILREQNPDMSTDDVTKLRRAAMHAGLIIDAEVDDFYGRQATVLLRWAALLETPVRLCTGGHPERLSDGALRMLKLAKTSGKQDRIAEMRSDFADVKLLTGSVLEMAKLI
jgi:hypothetical protein